MAHRGAHPRLWLCLQFVLPCSLVRSWPRKSFCCHWIRLLTSLLWYRDAPLWLPGSNLTLYARGPSTPRPIAHAKSDKHTAKHLWSRNIDINTLHCILGRSSRNQKNSSFAGTCRHASGNRAGCICTIPCVEIDESSLPWFYNLR